MTRMQTIPTRDRRSKEWLRAGCHHEWRCWLAHHMTIIPHAPSVILGEGDGVRVALVNLSPPLLLPMGFVPK
jgi:hypothetical protein